MTTDSECESPEVLNMATDPIAVNKKPQKKGADHPTYAEMVTSAIKALNEKTGSSRQAIVKYISSNYSVDESKVNNQIRNALKRFVKSGLLKQAKGAGASGSFKISEDFNPKTPAKNGPKVKAPKKPRAPKKPNTPKEKKPKAAPKPRKQPKKNKK